MGNCEAFSITRVKNAEQGIVVVEADETGRGHLAEGLCMVLRSTDFP